MPARDDDNPGLADSSASQPPAPIIRTLGPKGPWLQMGSPDGFEWTHVTLSIPHLPQALVGTRIIHLSDIHATGKWYPAYDVLLDAIADSRPDLICITGDFVDDRFNHLPALPTIHRLAAGLSAPLGVFGILGNHDREHFEPRLIGTNITLLNGQRRIVERNGSPIELIGLPGAERFHLTPRWLSDIRRHPHTPGIPRIVLSHYPDHLRLIHRLTPDILLAGHTHGGQICLPGGFPLLKHDKLPRRFARGIHHLQNTWLIANRGFGFTGINLRLFCPSEVVEIELVG